MTGKKYVCSQSTVQKQYDVYFPVIPIEKVIDIKKMANFACRNLQIVQILMLFLSFLEDSWIINLDTLQVCNILIPILFQYADS